jgi:hypothetical protein
MVIGIRGIFVVACVVTLGLMLSACGSSNKASSTTSTTSVPAPPSAPSGTVVVQVGNTPITRAQYEHWMRIGDATVQKPLPGQPIPKPIDYEPPNFTECIARLRANALLHETTPQLKTKCQQTFQSIQTRILRFLINGYWLREEATEDGITISNTELQTEFNQTKAHEFPTPASFQRLLNASRQTIPDLMFAIETEMLSTKLQQKFSKPETKESPENSVEALNKRLDAKWTPRTNCLPGYVIKACRQYRAAR